MKNKCPPGSCMHTNTEPQFKSPILHTADRMWVLRICPKFKTTKLAEGEWEMGKFKAGDLFCSFPTSLSTSWSHCQRSVPPAPKNFLCIWKIYFHNSHFWDYQQNTGLGLGGKVLESKYYWDYRIIRGFLCNFPAKQVDQSFNHHFFMSSFI